MYWIILNHTAALAPLFLVIVTGFYAWKTKGIVEENKKLRDEQYRPRVVVGYEILRRYGKREEKKVYVHFVVRNIGLVSAFNIKLDIESDLIYSKQGNSISQIPFINSNIQYLMPNQDVKGYLFNITSPYEKIYESECYGTVTYSDSSDDSGKKYNEKFIIDFSHTKGLIFIE